MPKFNRVKRDALIKIEIGAAFYEQMKGVWLYLTMQGDHEKNMEVVQKMKTDSNYKPKDIYEECIIAMMSLVYVLETNAQQQGLLEEVDLEFPAP